MFHFFTQLLMPLHTCVPFTKTAQKLEVRALASLGFHAGSQLSWLGNLHMGHKSGMKKKMVFDVPDVPCQRGNSAKGWSGSASESKKTLTISYHKQKYRDKKTSQRITLPVPNFGQQQLTATIRNSLLKHPLKKLTAGKGETSDPKALKAVSFCYWKPRWGVSWASGMSFVGSPDSWLHYALELCDDSENAWHSMFR